MEDHAIEISASGVTDEVLDRKRSVLEKNLKCISPSVVWIVASLARGDGPVRCEAADVAIVRSSLVGRSLKTSRSRPDLSLWLRIRQACRIRRSGQGKDSLWFRTHKHVEPLSPVPGAKQRRVPLPLHGQQRVGIGHHSLRHIKWVWVFQGARHTYHGGQTPIRWLSLIHRQDLST